MLVDLLSMASIVRRRNAGVWTAMYRDSAGRQHCKSTGETDKKKARGVAERYEEAARNDAAAKQQLKVLSETLAHGGQLQTVRQYCKGWLTGKCHEVSPSTCEFYTRTIGQFLSFLGTRADQPLQLIVKSDLVEYRSILLGKVSFRTAGHHMSALGTLFRTAAIEDVNHH